ncbi:hypothetical protein P153DRAFT_185275 [Dothidotthia symphoricarpi CBS 119687]|uniref:RRM domain-containing protein n=1 Tax=Dothidotthia symphoricarpi CBS 119687 TaxID=1392245 RepID=A0A6A6AMP5_9PLEO|nr:uncharacterized protein P153DRAFT_185275 [Dothidotthia symphoricarpi CBS 119687]KAF2132157.1 hypothetical protein P153DRAFT_185275 [Dothidotthia symphoricarpi CBS 119687]
MSFSASWKDGDGDFLLVVSGLTRYAPYLTGWQEFKDHIRKIVKEQPGWVDVYASQSQRRGEMQGWCRLKDREDADAAYNIYFRSKGMLIHVWETCRSNEGFRLLKCNCSSHFLELAEGSHSAGRCGIDIGRVSHLTGGSRSYTVSTPQYMSAPPMYSYATYPSIQGYAVPSIYPVHTLPTQLVNTQKPVYSVNTSGFPVNVRDGAMLTETRGIFISGLSYKAAPADLMALLQSVGRPTEAPKMQRDPISGVFKGVATAKFSSKEEAQHAATHLNYRTHMGKTLNVRMDVDATVVGQTEPLIAVGSNTYRY